MALYKFCIIIIINIIIIIIIKKIGPQCILVWDFIQIWYGLNKWDKLFVLLFSSFCAVRFYSLIRIVNFKKGKAKI